MKFFISQPMGGLTDEEIKEERDNIVDYLSQHYENIEIIDSYFGHAEQKDQKRRSVYCLGESIELLADADICVFAHGWEDARGCKIEKEVCLHYGIPILYVDKLSIK